VSFPKRCVTTPPAYHSWHTYDINTIDVNQSHERPSLHSCIAAHRSCFWKVALHEALLQGALLTKPMKICRSAGARPTTYTSRHAADYVIHDERCFLTLALDRTRCAVRCSVPTLRHPADAAVSHCRSLLVAAAMQNGLTSNRPLDILQPCGPVINPFRPARASVTQHMRSAAGRQSCSCASQHQHDETATRQSQQACRRALLHAAASIAAFAAAAPALAVVEGFTPMTQLKGKDYGKARMRYPSWAFS
jgi:hypothetical protein